MDAIKFITERTRMCEIYGTTCKGCPLDLQKYCTCSVYIRLNPIETVSIVEQWSKEHPIVTNKMKFEEVFGRTCNENGELVLVRPSWWMEEYHEPKGE